MSSTIQRSVLMELSWSPYHCGNRQTLLYLLTRYWFQHLFYVSVSGKSIICAKQVWCLHMQCSTNTINNERQRNRLNGKVEKVFFFCCFFFKYYKWPRITRLDADLPVAEVWFSPNMLIHHMPSSYFWYCLYLSKKIALILTGPECKHDCVKTEHDISYHGNDYICV